MNFAFLSNEATIALLQYFYYFLPFVPYQPTVTNNFAQEYDYIIAGAGSAGAIVAARLSEDPCVKILLLEAGEQVDPITEIPGAATLAQSTQNDWSFPLKKQMGQPTVRDNEQIQAQGKGLGGTSLINYILYTRGNKLDFDQWEANGATGWAWQDVFPYFLKSEHNTDPQVVANGYHGTKGPLTVETTPDNNEIRQAFIAAGQEMGYEYIDTNGPTQTGFSILQGNTRNGRRCSTAKAFLIPAESRENLDIVNGAFVQKILINNYKVAYGVQFQKGGKVYNVNARKEVIVSLGVFTTPKILMLSGIGPKDHLMNFGIPVIADLPVGNNLQNHLGCTALKFTANPAVKVVSEDELAKSAQKFQMSATGSFTSPAGIEGLAYTNSKYNNPALDWPDIELSIVASVPKVLKPGYGYQDYDSDDIANPLVLFPFINRPKSRGTVRLTSTNPYDYPDLNFNILNYQEDLDILVEALKQSVNLTRTNAFQRIGAKLPMKKMPGCENYQLYSDDYLTCLAKKYARASNHPCCSCKMGAPYDMTAVVDPQLKVKGIKNLRIVDASIIPTIVSAYTNAAVNMIAEKAADMIKWDNPDRENCWNNWNNMRFSFFF